MGAHPYWYYVPYEQDVEAALAKLRDREFKAGRYNPVIPFLENFDDSDFLKLNPGQGHDSIEAALEDSAEDGTRSILDINSVSDMPDYHVAAPMSESHLKEVFGTVRPNKETVENADYMEGIERGHCNYFFVYDDKQ